MHLLFFFLVSLLACSENAVEDEKMIEVSTQALSFTSEASTQTILINANTNWVISSSDEWCTTSVDKGYAGETSVSISVAENNNLAVRNATLRISSVTYVKEIKVAQSFFIQEVDIEDERFKSYVKENLDVNDDGIFSLDEAANLNSIDISALGITSLKGIENFTALEILNCSDNELTEIDLSSLKLLKNLDCSYNSLSELNIRSNINILSLNCTENPSLTSIYVWSGFNATSGFSKPESAQYIQPEITTPVGYELIWQDEFNSALTESGKATLPNTATWWYETGANGWGNNEIQNYIAGVKGQDTCAMISDGTLKIIAKKSGDEVLSIRMNTKESWTYGYFEARLKLPVGKGTWPAFWMLPKNFTSWPGDGEIDIMEEVGANPNHVSSSIHCTAYNHSLGTQKTAEKYIPTAESEFHIYAVEWTEDYIKGLIDGEVYFTFNNDHANNKDTWPFNEPFYLKLNLAWGGDWGGYLGIDENALPTTYEIDYVRVFQKF